MRPIISTITFSMAARSSQEGNRTNCQQGRNLLSKPCSVSMLMLLIVVFQPHAYILGCLLMVFLFSFFVFVPFIFLFRTNLHQNACIFTVQAQVCLFKLNDEKIKMDKTRSTDILLLSRLQILLDSHVEF